MKALTFLLLCFASVALADDFKTTDGKEYKNVTVSLVEPDGIVLMTKSGISKVYFTELPKEVQERFNYDTAKGTAYSAPHPPPSKSHIARLFPSSDRNRNNNDSKRERDTGANIRLRHCNRNRNPRKDHPLTWAELHLIDRRIVSPPGQ